MCGALQEILLSGANALLLLIMLLDSRIAGQAADQSCFQPPAR